MNVASAVGTPPDLNAAYTMYPQPALATLLQIDWSTVPDLGIGCEIPPFPMAAPIEEPRQAPTQVEEMPIEVAVMPTLSVAGLKNDPQRRFRPYGTFETMFYDQSEVVCVGGPAGTGKSKTILEKLHAICEKYKGARILMVRQTRESLSEAAMFTFETHVLPVGHYLLTGATRSHRQKYSYRTSSEIVCGGLDKPGKMMSTEYDIIYVQEALDVSRADVEMLKTRLRNGVVPYQQIILDYNPGDPMHWIRQAQLKGEFSFYETNHEDNPTLWEEAPTEVQQEMNRLTALGAALGRFGEIWNSLAPDGRRGRWTTEGAAYIAKLDALTGARYWRLRRGKWVTAEGAVYEDYWNTSINLIPRAAQFPIPYSWRRIWTIDFGFTSPFCLQMWAIDPNGVMYRYKEIYYTRRLVEDHAKQALELAGWKFESEVGYTKLRPDPDILPECVVCDVDAEGRETFERKTGIRCVAAYKSSTVGINEGIQAVQKRMKADEFGRARLYLFADVVAERDPLLKDAALPQCTEEEIDGYIWDTRGNQRRGEKPLDKNDHGCDPMRYGVCFVDEIVGDVKASDVLMGADDLYPGMVVAIPNMRFNGTNPTVDRHSNDPTQVRRHDEHIGIPYGRAIGGRKARRLSYAEERSIKTGRESGNRL